MKKVYFLSTCDTCKRIIKELGLKEKGFLFQDIKFDKITSEQINEMKDLCGSFEALFSKVSRLYKERKLSEVDLSESDKRKLILEEYTFLKRPVILYNNQIFIGNSKDVLARAKEAIG